MQIFTFLLAKQLNIFKSSNLSIITMFAVTKCTENRLVRYNAGEDDTIKSHIANESDEMEPLFNDDDNFLQEMYYKKNELDDYDIMKASIISDINLLEYSPEFLFNVYFLFYTFLTFFYNPNDSNLSNVENVDLPILENLDQTSKFSWYDTKVREQLKNSLIMKSLSEGKLEMIPNECKEYEDLYMEGNDEVYAQFCSLKFILKSQTPKHVIIRLEKETTTYPALESVYEAKNAVQKMHLKLNEKQKNGKTHLKIIKIVWTTILDGNKYRRQKTDTICEVILRDIEEKKSDIVTQDTEPAKKTANEDGEHERKNVETTKDGGKKSHINRAQNARAENKDGEHERKNVETTKDGGKKSHINRAQKLPLENSDNTNNGSGKTNNTKDNRYYLGIIILGVLIAVVFLILRAIKQRS